MSTPTLFDAASTPTLDPSPVSIPATGDGGRDWDGDWDGGGPGAAELWPRLIDALYQRDRDAALDWLGLILDAMARGSIDAVPAVHFTDFIHAIYDALGEWSDETRPSPFACANRKGGKHHAQ